MQNDLLFIQNTSIDSTEYEERFVNLTANKVVFVDINNLPTTTGIGLSSQFLKADGSLDSTTYENGANKVTSFQVAPDNTHYASEKLTKDSLDLKIPYTGATADLDLGLNSLNANTIKLDGTELLVNTFKSGSLGGAGNIFYSTGASSQPASGTVNQVIGGNTLTSSYLPYWDGTKLANTIASNEAQGIVITKESGDVYFKAKSGVSAGMFGADVFAAYISSNNNLMWYAENNINNFYQPVIIKNLLGTGTRLVTASSTGQLGSSIISESGTVATVAGTLSATNLTDGYLPLHQNDVNGLVNSNIYQDGGGNVGIGTTYPGVKLQVNGGCQTGPTLGSPVGGFALTGSNNLYGMYAGVSLTGDTWIQSQRNDASTEVYRLLLQPSGGNVGIGTTTPLSKLSINGGLHVGGDSDAGDNNILADGTVAGTQLISNIATGTPPLVVASSTLNTNLNADLLDGQHGSYYQTASSKIKLTPEGGYAILLTNKTGANSIKGTVVYADPAVDSAFEVNPINGDMPFGVVYVSGIIDGSECWVVVSGIAEVLLVNTVASTRSYVAYSSGSVAGRIDIAATVPAATTHFREIGHTMESKTGGTDVLIKCLLHFN